MRFSAIFQLPLPRPRAAQPAEPARNTPLPPPQDRPAQVQELPDELDARVRLVGEWQLGEG